MASLPEMCSVFISQAKGGVGDGLCLREGCDRAWLDENDAVSVAFLQQNRLSCRRKEQHIPLRPQSVQRREELDALLVMTEYLVWRITDF